MKAPDPVKIKETIESKMAPVVPEHTEKEHFYRVQDEKLPDLKPGDEFPLYPSVTGKLQIIKDPSIINYKMNRALEYIFANFDKIDEGNLMEHLDNARNESVLIFEDAGHLGKDIHDIREDYLRTWIKDQKRPDDILSFIPEVKEDTRIISGLRGFSQFIDDFHYEPLFCELYVYSHKLQAAGTLDDLGIMRWPYGKGRKLSEWFKKEWDEDSVVYDPTTNLGREASTGEKFRKVLVLSDLKTSNQIKPHYYLQVALYWYMLRDVTGVATDKAIIVKVDKENGRYKVENLHRPATLASHARSLIRVGNALDMIDEIRKDNQKRVVEL